MGEMHGLWPYACSDRGIVLAAAKRNARVVVHANFCVLASPIFLYAAPMKVKCVALSELIVRCVCCMAISACPCACCLGGAYVVLKIGQHIRFILRFEQLPLDIICPIAF